MTNTVSVTVSADWKIGNNLCASLLCSESPVSTTFSRLSIHCKRLDKILKVRVPVVQRIAFLQQQISVSEATEALQ